MAYIMREKRRSRTPPRLTTRGDFRLPRLGSSSYTVGNALRGVPGTRISLFRGLRNATEGVAYRAFVMFIDDAGRRTVEPRLGRAFSIAMVGMVLACAGPGAGLRRASGELFLLQSGGKVSGQLVPQDPPDKDHLTIKTDAGATITLARSQIKQTLHQRPEEIEYEKLRVRAADTVEGQWELAEWCRENRLTAQREKHLKRIIELDPDDRQARLALGYERHGDTWTTQEEQMTKNGYVRYKGRWRLPQEIEIMEKERKKVLAEKEWIQKIAGWRSWLGTGRDQQARDNLMAIKDNAAIKGLAEALKNDSRDDARRVFIDALAHVGTTPALMALTAWTMQEQVQDLCLSCLEHLRKAKCHEAVVYFVGKLQSKDNTEVNRAGMALGAMGDPTAVDPLIDSLITTHKFKIVTGNPGQTSATFGNGPGNSSPGGGLSVGGGPKIVYRQIPNESVHDALVLLTGTDYGFEIGQWKAWHALQRQRPTISGRRGTE